MLSGRNGSYPYHLAKLVAERLHSSQPRSAPSDKILLKLFETLYFASLKTDEGRLCRCTVNYVDPQDPMRRTPGFVSFEQLGESEQPCPDRESLSGGCAGNYH